MAIIVDNDTKLVVQGLTGREGSFHGVRNRDRQDERRRRSYAGEGRGRGRASPSSTRSPRL